MKICKLSEIAKFKTGKLNSNAAEMNGRYPFFTCAPEPLKIDTYAFDTKAIILAGNNAEGNFHIQYFEGKFNAYQRTYIIETIDNSIVDIRYLYYALKMCLQHFKLISQGTATKFLTAKILSAFELPIPTIEEQQKIAFLLSGLDEKVKTNERINNNLEQQVTTVFYNMFGKYEQNSNTHKPLSTIAKFKYGTMPKKDKLGTGHYHAFSGYQIVGTYPEVMFENPQLIIVARGVGGCGDVKYTPANCYLTNLSIAIITEKTMHDDYLYHYLRLHDTKIMNTGSAQPQITVATLEKFEIPIPPEEEMIRFSDFVQPFKQQYRNNQDENKLLSKLRDTLLPKLMSGELDISDIDL